MQILDKVIKHYSLNGNVIKAEPHGNGHINSTYLLETDKGEKYILQKINNGIFPNVSGLMGNVVAVTEYARKVIEKRGGDPDRESITVVYDREGKSYVEVDGGFYRIIKYIDGVVYQVVASPEDFYQSAVAFGNFAKLLANFDAKGLVEVIPNFHNTVSRFKDFKKAIADNKAGRLDSVKEEVQFYLDREEYCSKIVELLDSGEMPVRVTHNDTKLNNVIFDKDTNKYLAVLDLDTIMPGSLCYDFGDSIRFGCNPCEEDERDLSKVIFDMNLFEQYVKGYLSSMGDDITQVEKDHLAFSAILMTYECGMRFLGDHLNGDTYFKTHRENQNLDRTRTHIKLISDMEARFKEMMEIVEKY